VQWKELNIKKQYSLGKTGHIILEIPPTIFLDSNLDKALQVKYLLSLDKQSTKKDELNFVERGISSLNTFRYRGLLFSLILSLTKPRSDKLTGYLPLKRESICQKGPKCKDFSDVDLARNLNEILSFSAIKKINEVLGDKKNKVIFVSSPFYNNLNPVVKKDINILGTAISKLRSEGYTVLDYRLDERFRNVDEYFSDSVHLNYKSAEVFSRVLSKDIGFKKLNNSQIKVNL
jgi:hypothetical protein